MAAESDIRRIAIVGAGSMGSMMALGLAERGFDISLWDIDPDNVEKAKEQAKGQEQEKRISFFTSLEQFVDSNEGQKEQTDAQARRVFLFSITHGPPADSVLEKMLSSDRLRKGDIFLDGGNELWQRTERRQGDLAKKGITWIGMGVSGGYQSARHGPSITMGGDKEAIEYVLPALTRFAARNEQNDEPCIANVGPKGSGHYVKMVHNGIEQGMLGALSEAVSLLRTRFELDEIAKIMEAWNEKGELQGTYLIDLSARIAGTRKTPKGDGGGEGTGDSGHVLDDVLDKVVQDDDGSEGTGMWTVQESAARHISAPSIAAAHYLRIASGNRASRSRVSQKLKTQETEQAPFAQEQTSKEQLLRVVEQSLKCAFLASFCQGLELIARTSKQEQWDVDLAVCLRAWRAGCIIRCDAIVDPLLYIFVHEEDRAVMNVKMVQEVSDKLRQTLPALKQLLLWAVRDDYIVPTLSATLEYVKYVGSDALPTDFMEALMDAFGAHAFDRKGVQGEDPGKTGKGAHHYEWVPV